MLEYPQNLVMGVDEAGRGPLAGPVVAAAVILDPQQPILGLNDSKKLSEKKRHALAQQIREKALDFAVAFASVEEIDALNILQATFLAMRRAVLQIQRVPEKILIDGNQIPPQLPFCAEAMVKGDALHASIAAASILAKTARDAWMCELHERFPQYAFDQHKGYATARHLVLLKQFGACCAHRKSFAPIRQITAQSALSLNDENH